jgi:transcriptional regulator with XRE-family HTH domain
MTLGTTIKTLRQQLHMTQGQLATYSNTDQSYLSRIERDKHPDISYRVIAKIAYALRVPVGSLLREAGVPVRPNPASTAPLSLQEERLLDIVRSIPSLNIRLGTLELAIGFATVARDADAARQEPKEQ